MDFNHVFASDKYVYVITQSIADTNVSMQKNFSQHTILYRFSLIQ